jgi:hypothetical protein
MENHGKIACQESNRVLLEYLNYKCYYIEIIMFNFELFKLSAISSPAFHFLGQVACYGLMPAFVVSLKNLRPFGW